MLYRVTLNTPDPYDRAYSATKTAIVGSLKAARLLAAEWLASHTRYETAYSARVNRSADCTIQSKEYRETNRYREMIEATTHIVPSVGDLGYSP